MGGGLVRGYIGQCCHQVSCCDGEAGWLGGRGSSRAGAGRDVVDGAMHLRVVGSAGGSLRGCH